VSVNISYMGRQSAEMGHGILQFPVNNIILYGYDYSEILYSGKLLVLLNLVRALITFMRGCY
jgi:hypothetical protein